MTLTGAPALPELASEDSLPTGPVLFGQYAFGPNRYGLCGPDDWKAIADTALSLGHTSRPGASQAREVDRVLRRLALDFEGALPYLQLIASANGIGDQLDARVVEAYWIGNRLTEGVSPALLTGWLDAHYKARLKRADWHWLASKPRAGAKPTHAFHVLDVFRQVGSARDGVPPDAVRLMDACRVRWGRVVDVNGTAVVVHVRPLEMQAGKLVLGPPRIETVQRWPAAHDPDRRPKPGGIVSVHWGWICEVLTERRADSLARHTLAQIAITNQSI